MIIRSRHTHEFLKDKKDKREYRDEIACMHKESMSRLLSLSVYILIKLELL